MPRYTFGPFSLDPEARLLLRDGEPVPMAGKALDTLVVLVQNRGCLVDKDELLSRVWPGAVVEEANLSQSVFTVRKILGDSPKDPRYIATVAGRGYQFVAPVRELIENSQTGGAPQIPVDSTGNSRRRNHNKLVATSFSVVAALVVFWLLLRRPAKAPAELVERRLTFNSSANPIVSALISPDGKYLAYSDTAGIHLRLLLTGEERWIPAPAGVPTGASHVDSWFPNGTELLAHSEDDSGHHSMWAVSVMGQSSRDLRDDASGEEVSPDGTHIAFNPIKTASGAREIWVMDSRGAHARKVLGFAAGEFVWSVHWSPDGQRLVYVRMLQDRQLMETCDLNGANRTLVLAGEARSVCWLPNRRIVYSRGEARDLDANLWQIGVDTATGRPIGEPHRITHWAGADLQGMSASADGTRIVLLKETFPNQVYVSELAAGGSRMSPPRRLTDDEADTGATAWTADGSAMLLASNRNGKWGIYRQKIGQNTPTPLIEGRGKLYLPRLSADGAWVLYVETTATASGRFPHQRLMRVPVNGGLPKLVFEFTRGRWEDHMCARAPATLCLAMESLDDKQLTVTALDPVRGKGKLLRTIDKAVKEVFNHAISPDGSTLAIAKGNEPEIHIRLLSLNGGPDREIAVKGWPNIVSMEWSADGRGIYCGSTSFRGDALLYVDLKGIAQVLWQTKDTGASRLLGGVPSPDGRYVALWGPENNSTAWIVENF